MPEKKKKNKISHLSPDYDLLKNIIRQDYAELSESSQQKMFIELEKKCILINKHLLRKKHKTIKPNYAIIDKLLRNKSAERLKELKADFQSISLDFVSFVREKIKSNSSTFEQLEYLSSMILNFKNEYQKTRELMGNEIEKMVD